MKLTWGPTSYERLLSKIKALALRFSVFDISATHKDYERLKAELTNAVIGKPYMEENGRVSFAIARTALGLARHEEAR